jgi:hypothetical protein
MSSKSSSFSSPKERVSTQSKPAAGQRKGPPPPPGAPAVAASPSASSSLSSKGGGVSSHKPTPSSKPSSPSSSSHPKPPPSRPASASSKASVGPGGRVKVPTPELLRPTPAPVPVYMLREAMRAKEALRNQVESGGVGDSESNKDAVARVALIGTVNPHCEHDPISRVDLEYGRVIGPNYGRLPYLERGNGKKYVRTEHWGQRKLFVSEVEFLQKCVPRDATNVVVIYAGAGPGTHLSLLSDMFPSYTFVLIDPVKIEVPAVENRIIIHQCYFTAKMAHELKRAYAGSTLFFISDIRPDLKGGPEDEQIIMKNMEDQAEWHFILGGKSMLKFRLPYTAGTTSYLKGELYLPVWGPQSTTECRLVVGQDCGYQAYDHGEHEQRMSYFNKVVRTALYPHGVRGCGLDHCYDCTAEVNILRDYLGSADISIVRDFLGVDASDEGIAAFSKKISSAISGGTQTLASRIEQRRREGARTSVMRGRM